MAEARTLVFDWHGQRGLPGDRAHLLEWLIPATMRPEDRDRLTEVTDRLSRCELRIEVSGVQLDAARFLDGVAGWVRDAAAEEAVRLMAEVNLDGMTEALVAARQVLCERLRAAGVPVEDEDWDG